MNNDKVRLTVEGDKLVLSGIIKCGNNHQLVMIPITSTTTIKEKAKPSQQTPPPSQAVTFTKGKDNKVIMLNPVEPAKNYPVKCYFNLEKLSTALVFADGTNVRVSVDQTEEGYSQEGKNVTNGLIIALARRILGYRVSLSQFYDKFKSTEAAEAFFYGVVLEHFVNTGIVKNSEQFELWLVNYVATRVTTIQLNPRPAKVSVVPGSPTE
jgi:hypothetical protein